MRPLTLDTVLVATDLSAAAVPAMRSAIELARLSGATLHAVHAADRARQDLDALFAEHVRAADPGRGIEPELTIRIGRADRVVAEIASLIEADVVVLGPHRPDESRSPGGTAYRVVARAERPCLVLPCAVHLPLGRILAPVDASVAARGALAVAMTWASALRRRTPPGSPDATALTMLHVDAGDHVHGSSADATLNDAMSAVNELVAGVAGVRVQRVAVTAADVASAILDHARQDSADLIVLGTRAEGVSASGLGSVSSSIVRSATCPLLLVPPRVWRELASDPAF